MKLYSNWHFEKGGTGWGNQELQYYCDGGIYEPTVRGCWPAFWMLLTDGPSYVRDPSQTGAEIDVMEYVPGDNPNRVWFSAHSYNATGEAGSNTGYVDPATGIKHPYSDYAKVSSPQDWHCYGMEWTHEYIRAKPSQVWE